MGSNNSKNEEFSQDGLRRFGQNFEFLKTENDPRFGSNVMIYSERSSKKLIALLNRATEDDNLTERLRHELKIRLGLDHKNFARVVGFTKMEDETLCGVNHQLSVYNEYFENDLELEIQDRVPKKEYFQESEIWYVANSIVSYGSYFETNGIYHGDIRPINVLMSEEGNVYLMDHGLLHPSKNNLNKAFSGDRTVFLSPRELDILKTKSETAEYDVYKSDVFSAGITLLYMCHLENPISLYNYTDCSFNSALHAQLIQDVERNYSKPLADLISWMTEYDETKRPDFHAINNTIQNQGKPITNPAAIPQENLTQNYSSPSRNQRGITSPANIHYGKSPVIGEIKPNEGSSLVNSQISGIGQTINPQQQFSPVNNTVPINNGSIGYNIPQQGNTVLAQTSPIRTNIVQGTGQPIVQGNIPGSNLPTLYSYPAHYFK